MEKKPDFDQIFTEMYGHPDIPSDRIIGIQDCWNIYVTSLQSQLSEAEKRIKELEEEIETLRKFDER